MSSNGLSKGTADNAGQAYKVILQSDYDTEEAYFTEVTRFIEKYFTCSNSTAAQGNDLTRQIYTKKYGGKNGLTTEIYVDTDFDLARVTLEYQFLIDFPYERLPLLRYFLNNTNRTLRYINFFIDETRRFPVVAKYRFNILGAFSQSAFLATMEQIDVSLFPNACKLRYLSREESAPEYIDLAVSLTEDILFHLPAPAEISSEMELLEQALLAAGKPVTARTTKLLTLLLNASLE